MLRLPSRTAIPFFRFARIVRRAGRGPRAPACARRCARDPHEERQRNTTASTASILLFSNGFGMEGGHPVPRVDVLDVELHLVACDVAREEGPRHRARRPTIRSASRIPGCHQTPVTRATPVLAVPSMDERLFPTRDGRSEPGSAPVRTRPDLAVAAVRKAVPDESSDPWGVHRHDS
jgi:hypothetical protein